MFKKPAGIASNTMEMIDRAEDRHIIPFDVSCLNKYFAIL